MKEFTIKIESIVDKHYPDIFHNVNLEDISFKEGMICITKNDKIEYMYNIDYIKSIKIE